MTALILLELMVLLAMGYRMMMNMRPFQTSPELLLPSPVTYTLTKSQENTQALLRWQDSFDLLEARANVTSRSR